MTKKDALEIRIKSAAITLAQIRKEFGPQAKVKFRGHMTAAQAIKKIKEAAKRENIKLIKKRR